MAPSPHPGDDRSHHDPADDAAVGSPRRRRRGVAVAAATALAIGVGVGGYAIGSQNGGSPDPGLQARDAADPNADEPMSASERLIAGDDDPESAQGSEQGATTSSTGSSGPILPEVLTAGESLSSDSPGTGEVTRSTTGDVDHETLVPQAIDALNLPEGALETNDGGTELWWESEDGEEWGHFGVNVFGGAWVNFDRTDAIAVSCQHQLATTDADTSGAQDQEVSTGEPPATVEGDTDDSDEPPPYEPGPCDGPQVSEQEALDAAAEFVDTIGLESSEYSFEIREDGSVDPYFWEVRTTLDDGPDGSGGHISITDNGVAGASFPLRAQEESLGEYPLASPREAVENHADLQFSNVGVDSAEVYDGSQFSIWADEPEDVPDTEPINSGDPIPAWVNEVVIEEAELTSATHYVNGVTLTAPAYLLTGADGQVYAVTALAPDAFDFSSLS